MCACVYSHHRLVRLSPEVRPRPTQPQLLPLQSCVEYVWIGGQGTDLHSHTRVIERAPSRLEDIPKMTVDGRACGLACDRSTDVVLEPCAVFADPFREGDNVLVLCEAFVPRMVCTCLPSLAYPPTFSHLLYP